MQRCAPPSRGIHALQCGYCTPGMLATSRDIVLRLPQADEGRVRVELSGNLCRCTGYMGIVAAVMSVLAELRAQPDPAVDALRPPWRRAGRRARDGAAGGLRGIHAGGGWRRRRRPNRVRSRRRASRQEGRPGQPDRRRFHRALSAAEVWAFMVDLPALASCCPAPRSRSMRRPGQGQDRHQVRTHVRRLQRRGPPGARRRRHAGGVPGAGQDSLSQSRANGDITYPVQALSPGETQVHVNLLYSLQAPGAVFAVRAGAGLRAPHDRGLRQQRHRPAARAAAGEAPVQASFNPTAMFFSVLWARIKRWFGRGG